MDKEKLRRLERDGWKIGTVKELLGLSDREMEQIELKVRVALAEAKKKHSSVRGARIG